MRLIRGYALEVYDANDHAVGGIRVTLLGPEKNRWLSGACLEHNGLILFSTLGEAAKVRAYHLASPRSCFFAPKIVEMEIEIARNQRQLESLQGKSDLFAIQFGDGTYCQIFGTSTPDEKSGDSRGFDGRQHYELNGLKPFSSFADADRAASEMIRQGGSTIRATVARIEISFPPQRLS